MPAPSTPRLLLPVPSTADPADVPHDQSNLATRLDVIAAAYGQGTAAARPAAGIQGRIYYATDTKTTSYDDGAAWQTIQPPTAARLYRDADLAVAGTLPVPMLKAAFDLGACFNATNGTYVVKFAGIYQLSAALSMSTSGGVAAGILMITKGGVEIIRGTRMSTNAVNGATFTGGGLVQLAVNDAIGVQWFSLAGSTVTKIDASPEGTFLSAARVG